VHCCCCCGCAEGSREALSDATAEFPGRRAVILEWLLTTLLRSATRPAAGRPGGEGPADAAASAGELPPALDAAYWALAADLLGGGGGGASSARTDQDGDADDDSAGLANALRTPIAAAWPPLLTAVFAPAVLAPAAATSDAALVAAAAALPHAARAALVAAWHQVYVLLRDRHGRQARPTLEQLAALAAAALQAVTTAPAPLPEALVAFALDVLHDLHKTQLGQAVQRKVFTLFCSKVLAPLLTALAAPVCPAQLAALAAPLLRDSVFHADVLAEFNLAVTAAHPVDAAAAGAAASKRDTPGKGATVQSFQRQLFAQLGDVLASAPASTAAAAGVTADAVAGLWPLLLDQFRAALDARAKAAMAVAASTGYATRRGCVRRVPQRHAEQVSYPARPTCVFGSRPLGTLPARPIWRRQTRRCCSASRASWSRCCRRRRRCRGRSACA